MSSAAFEKVRAVFDALAERAEQAAELMSTAEHTDWLELVETLGRMLPALGHEHINELAEHATCEELGASLPRALADRLRISRGEATRRIEEAADLGPRRAFNGEALPPKLEYTAAAQCDGQISAEQVRLIRGFFAQLPGFIDAATRTQAEQHLAAVAAAYRPDHLRRFAAHLELVLNPDGNFTDADRARRRGITLGPQGPDGMSRISGWMDPALRAGLDAILAKWAAPGMCNPADENPVINGAPSPEDVDADVRSSAQRNHDALAAIVRSTLMSGELGSHHGLPVTIIATATLEDLHNKTGAARTATGTRLPITDLIAMAAQSYHYLLLFDKANRCALYKGRTTRLATPAQRLVLTATERGCSHPGCDIPAAWCQVHHLKDWARGGATDIDNLTLACGPDNLLADTEGWNTRKNQHGDT
ncbi:MAG: HNH endonuclease, partial [Mycobacteriaceae bacterium]|nr:HNH endonuclease [Mycobacteriaceae bacterium]